MKKLILRTTALAVLGLVSGALVGPLILHSTNEPSEVILGSFSVRTADAAGQPRLDRQSAANIADVAAAKRLKETIPGLAMSHGGDLTIADLRVADSVFAPAALEVTSSVSSFRYATNPPASLWVFIYRAEGVELPDWGVSGVVEVDVVINDETGRVESAGVLRYNPNAQP